MMKNLRKKINDSTQKYFTKIGMPEVGKFLTADINAKNARTAGSFICLMAALLTGGCYEDYNHKRDKIISGQVISEEFKETVRSIKYNFSLQTDEGVKKCAVITTGNAKMYSLFDSLIDEGDEIEILGSHLESLDQIIKINNKYYHAVSGKIKSENLNSDKYVFTLDTKDGLKTFECDGEESKQLEELFKKDDEVTIKMLYWQDANDNTLYVKSLNQILELNGERQK